MGSIYDELIFLKPPSSFTIDYQCLNMEDIEGYTPIHAAIDANNHVFLAKLFQMRGQDDLVSLVHSGKIDNCSTPTFEGLSVTDEVALQYNLLFRSILKGKWVSCFIVCQVLAHHRVDAFFQLAFKLASEAANSD
mmetsp:Transcript_3860/g.6559  ORF Transcript_3860/g.6559 Transcript_3860/m.6559 type:complete len:135 (+) Transcript_3860:234-638(+)